MTDDRDAVARKTRLLDHDRQKYAQTMQTQMQKNNDTITGLRRENDKLKHDLAATSNSTYKLTDQEHALMMSQDNELLQQKYDFEKMREADLDRKIETYRMDTLQARRSMGGVNITADNTQLIDKQVRVLENRLDQAVVQFNEALAYNRELRLQIDNLRGERKVFNDIYRKLETELHDKKRLMAEVIERSNHDYEERDALLQQLEALKAAAAEDAKKYDEHFVRLEELIAKNKAAQHQQQQQALQAAALKQSQAQKERSLATTNDGAAEDRSKKTKTANAADGDAAAQASAKGGAPANGQPGAAGEEVGELQDIVDHLKEATGVQDLDVLYQKFQKAEEHNFSMYNFVNELNAEVEQLDGDIALLEEQLAVEKGDVQRRQLLKSLENELAATEEKHQVMDDRTGKLREHVDVVRKIAKDIFDKIGCSTEMADEQLGTHDCTEMNVANFLGLIEHKTTELLYAFSLSMATDQRRRQAQAQEEARKRKERQESERRARIEAGETTAADEENDDADDLKDDDAGLVTGSEHARAKFVGVGPAFAPGSVSAASLVLKDYALPTTSSGDGSGGGNDGGGGGGGGGVTAAGQDDVDEDAIIDHATLRRDMEERLKAKREKDNAGRRPRGNRNKK